MGEDDIYVPCQFYGNSVFLKPNSKEHVIQTYMNGKIKIYSLHKEEVQWEMNLGTTILGISRGYFSKSKKEELCVTTWNGYTFIFNDKKESVYLNLTQNIEAFFCEKYSTSPNNKESLCLFYSTVDQRVMIFEDVDIESIKLKGLDNIFNKSSKLYQICQERKEDKNKISKLVNSIAYQCSEEELDLYLEKLSKQKGYPIQLNPIKDEEDNEKIIKEEEIEEIW